MSRFAIDVQQEGPDIRVLVGGDFDADSLEAFRSTIDGLDQGAERVVLDLADLSFIDSTGVQAAQIVEARFKEVVVLHAPPIARRIFEASGLDRLLADP